MNLLQAMTIVRRFRGHTDRITDLTVSSDCRWLLSASMDGTVRVWDIPDSRTFQARAAIAPVLQHLGPAHYLHCCVLCASKMG